jgi:hypothetical protein
MEDRRRTVHVDDTVFPLASSDNKVPRLSGASVALSLTSKTVLENTTKDATESAKLVPRSRSECSIAKVHM